MANACTCSSSYRCYRKNGLKILRQYIDVGDFSQLINVERCQIYKFSM